ncbi:MAG: 5-(carboxyamino)imidazole ribonucleotide mutase [Phycisphaerales bacterium]|nr:MAG: 5-(carboxyamino)imidazole ribonucleotide mutase [Phycisphaerales bacterium]
MVSEKTTTVAVVMGSDSDLKIMDSCVAQLREFGIDAAVRIISAHRTPAIADEFAQTAEANGFKVIIAAAGMAAHLAGALAARSTLPVIGVPLVCEAGLGGMDALLSTVQMPPGVPVATMGVGKAGAKNAAILAVQILALQDAALRQKLTEFRQQQEQTVRAKDAAIAS